jgi:2-methylcitrate dehydratase PrpD
MIIAPSIMSEGGQPSRCGTLSPSRLEDRQVPLTYLAARRLEHLRTSRLTPKVEHKSILCLLDYLGALISGLSATWSGALLKCAQAMSPSGGNALVLGLGPAVAADVAAFTSAAIAHRFVFDPGSIACASVDAV